MDSCLRRNDGKEGQDRGVGGCRERGVSGGGPWLIWGADGNVDVAWIPACAGMTERRGGNDAEGAGTTGGGGALLV